MSEGECKVVSAKNVAPDLLSLRVIGVRLRLSCQICDQVYSSGQTNARSFVVRQEADLWVSVALCA